MSHAVVQADVEPELVLAALDRALTSRELRQSQRSREFLAYVVTETLAGRAHLLSERTVARRALGHGADFDGTSSSAVRVSASRVRRNLERYYAFEGRNEPVRISVPAGGYVPLFERRDRVQAGVLAAPGVAVVELSSAGASSARALALSLSQTLTNRLAHYPDIRLVGPTALSGSIRETGAALGVTTVLEGAVVVRDAHAHVSVRLHAASTGEVLWATDDVLDRAELAGFEAEARWAQEIAARLGDATGLVVRQQLAGPPPDEPQLAARLAFCSYVDRGTIESVHEAVAALDAALDGGSRTPALLAMRAALANACVQFDLGDRQAELDRAASLAREALTLDGSNAHAHLVLGSVARDHRQWQLAIEHAETAARLAAYQPSYLVGAGIMASGSGAWERGAELIREGHRLHPGLAGHTHAWLAINHLVHADHARALAESSLLPSGGGFVWGPLYRAMALAGLSRIEQAGTELDQACAMRPEIVQDPAAYFDGRMRLTADQLEHLVALVQTASSSSAHRGTE